MHCFFDIWMIREISKMLNYIFSVFPCFLNEFFMIFLNKFLFILFYVPLEVLSEARFWPILIKYWTTIDTFVVINFYRTAIIAELVCAMACHKIAAFGFLYKSTAPRTLFNTFICHFLLYLNFIYISVSFVLHASLSRMRFGIAIETYDGLALVTFMILYGIITFNFVILFYLCINELALRGWAI